MISSVSPVEFNSNLRALGNASQDYLNLAMLIEVQKSLQSAIEEFIMTYDPKKYYTGAKSIGKATIGLNLNALA
ncbi:hypothetical protein ABG79_02210 [Caloramator mitchellensis]|uniref:Uncharacterized protein n=1 Tax=Caloramator mitchellensis TaxID=908809 RepID=A0A0R3JXQ6_CALMK|nr:hypothetical protein [Caloramator mitchellensis]KRQ85982.1 hypothetical protein ABG79_02210 [Caloramator mitchellensis]